jgi:multiple sugar transport system substrate-binding protein
VTDLRFPRRDFLRLAAGGATLLATGAGCGSGSESAKSRAGTPTAAADAKGRPTLRVAQWRHGVPAYDAWFDNDFAKRWGEEHDVEVIVDHLDLAELPGRAEAEVAARGPHDIFGFVYPPPTFEDEVIDHRDVVEEVEAKLGRMTPLVERSIFNPRTNKYFGFCDGWAADPVNYRADLWDKVQPGLTPDTWASVVRAGPKLKSLGHPLGIGMSREVDSNLVLMDLMHSYGASIQDEGSTVTINRPATVEAVTMGTALYRAGMTDDMFAWDAYSNNRFLASGTGSFILNAISAIRTVEGQQPDLAPNIHLVPPPAGAAARLGLPHIVNISVIWRFSEHQDSAKQFLIDLTLKNREAFVQSAFYNLPAYPGAAPDLAELVSKDEKAKPPGKYALLREAGSWSTNLGHPGHANAAMDEVFNTFIVPRMFAAAARGEMSAAEAVAAAEAKIKPIFEKWREQGKI